MLKPPKNQASKSKNGILGSMLTLALFLTSCSITSPSTPPAEQANPTDQLNHQKGFKDNTPKGLINGLEAAGSSQLESTSKITSFDQLDNIEENLTWGDDENSVNLASLPTTKLNNGWNLSFNQALKEARLKQKPLFIWCTNSRSSLSPNSKKLYDELIKTNEFNQWALANFSTLKLDKHIQEPDQSTYLQKRKYTDQLFNQLGIRTYPTILIYTPDSHLIGKHNYINTRANYLWKKLKRSLKLAEKSIQKNQKQATKQGYRFWQLSNAKYPLFARMKRYQTGQVTLENLYQEKFSINTDKISNEDYNWLQLQRVKSQ